MSPVVTSFNQDLYSNLGSNNLGSNNYDLKHLIGSSEILSEDYQMEPITEVKPEQVIICEKDK
jgi:hypothetical protein